MTKGRVEAFSDGVIAIIITIMVLEMKAPKGSELADLVPIIPKFLSYVLSFIYLGIYWNNHHHLLHATKYVNGNILWANLFLLFCLSLIPFVTWWMGENQFAPTPVACYGVLLLMAAIAYWILQKQILNLHGKESLLAQALGKDLKGNLSPILYIISIPAAFYSTWVSGSIYILVAIIWLIPDRRIERVLINKNHETN